MCFSIIAFRITEEVAMLALRKLFSTITGMREVSMIRSRILFVYHVDTQPREQCNNILIEYDAFPSVVPSWSQKLLSVQYCFTAQMRSLLVEFTTNICTRHFTADSFMYRKSQIICWRAVRLWGHFCDKRDIIGKIARALRRLEVKPHGIKWFYLYTAEVGVLLWFTLRD